MNWIRLKVARFLDKIYPDACWLNLYFWAIGWQTLRNTFGENGNWKHQICRWNNEGTPYAYCNKCALTGRYFIGHPMPADSKEVNS